MADQQARASGAQQQAALISGVLGAHADVNRLQKQLAEVAAGKADPSTAMPALAEHWRAHGHTHRAVAQLLGEQVRAALLQQLYGWRDQLTRQLEAIEAAKEQRGA